MDTKSLEMLEFPQIKEILAGYTSFSASREQALELQPLQDQAQITRLLGQSAEARRLLALEQGFGIGSISDIREAARNAALGIMLEPGTLLDVRQTLMSLRELRASLSQVSADFPLLWEIGQGITPLPQVERDIGSCLDPSGTVLDTASPELARIRQQLRGTKEQLLAQLEAIVNSPRWHRFLQDTFITEREGRYVIPVKIECRHEIKGIIHDISNSAATVFLEPTSTVGLGNALRELVIAEKNEVERILGDLSAEVGTYDREITRGIFLAAELDLALAKARFAARIKATEPVMASPDQTSSRVLQFVDARHPLLFEKAVPFSVEMGRDFAVLLITGPNTGGKTVTLKTIGLLSLMAQAGLPIPAAPETVIPIFDRIYADIGDEQSIAQTLSTFSWHMSNIVRIIRDTTKNSLVLLDELGTSTDPAEGSALARAILHHFLSRRNLTVATTHYGDLKAYAYDTPGMQNASLEFNPETLQPTYHLTVGVPGGSNALATAARLGLAPEIIEEARGMLGAGTQEMEKLLGTLTRERERISTLTEEITAEKEKLACQNQEREKELKELKSKENRIIRETRDRVTQESAQLFKEIRQAAAELRKEKSAERVRQARETLARVQQQLASEAWQTRGEEQKTGAGEDSTISVGDTVWLKDAGLTATVLAISAETGQAEVQAGNTRITLDAGALEKAGAPQEQSPEFHAVRKPLRRAVPLELDLRGKRADEVEPLLDSYLNDAVQTNLAEVRIIHGFGTGALRQIVRDFASAHPLVQSFRSGARDEGGDGVTMVKL